MGQAYMDYMEAKKVDPRLTEEEYLARVAYTKNKQPAKATNTNDHESRSTEAIDNK
jgi:hypothetical protein